MALYMALCLLLAKPNELTTGGSEQQRETPKDQKKLYPIQPKRAGSLKPLL